VSTRIPTSPRLARAAADWAGWRAHLPELADLASRELGVVVTDRRSSWVRRLSSSRGDLFVKTYDYSTWADRLRDFGRRTGPWARPRAVREFDALDWLGRRGFAGPQPLAAAVWRRCGFVARACLVTSAFGDGTASTLLPDLDADDRLRLAAAIVTFVRNVHALGFRDRNLDLRNLLVARSAAGWSIAKIDSPRHVLRPPGRTDDALARADWARLLPQLRELGIDPHAAGA